MKLKTGKRNKTFIAKALIISSIIFFTYNCSNSIEYQLIGNWEINYVKWGNGDSMKVPTNDKYQLVLEKINGKLIFRDDMQNGNWSYEDSILTLISTPICTTFVDSLFLINDDFGNSSLLLKSGEQNIGMLTPDGIIAEKVTYFMNFIDVNDSILQLSSEGNTYIYKKIR